MEALVLTSSVMDRDGKKKLHPLFLSCIGSRLIFSVGWGHVRYMASTSPIFHSSSSSAGVDIRIGMCTVPDTQRTQVQPVGKNNTCPYIMSTHPSTCRLKVAQRFAYGRNAGTTGRNAGRRPAASLGDSGPSYRSTCSCPWPTRLRTPRHRSMPPSATCARGGAPR
jgi:hypothetical protein